MAEGTYEYECARAELLGVAAPNREDFEAAAALAHTGDEHEALMDVEVQHEQLKETHGKMDELNSILSVTQQRLNKFKVSACGSLTNLLKLRPAKESADSSDDVATEVVVTTATATAAAGETSIDGALDTLNAMKDEAARSDVQVMRKSAVDMQQKMSCQFDALDSLLSKAETAEYAMSKQNRDMKRMLK